LILSSPLPVFKKTLLIFKQTPFILPKLPFIFQKTRIQTPPAPRPQPTRRISNEIHGHAHIRVKR
jgi:hypothetical protein